MREAQIASLKKLRAERDQAAGRCRPDALTDAARTETGNLLELAIEAARAKATVGEISDGAGESLRPVPGPGRSRCAASMQREVGEGEP